MILCSIPAAFAAVNEPNLDDLSFSQMLKSVDLSKQPKAADLIRKFQNLEARNKLLNGPLSPKKGVCTIEACRNKEVTLITIPASALFAPNSTDLLPEAKTYLNPIKRYMQDPDMFRVLLVMHTDNTGSEKYRDNITADRVDAVTAWFEDQGADTSYTFLMPLATRLLLCPTHRLKTEIKTAVLRFTSCREKKCLKKRKTAKSTFKSMHNS